MAAKYACRKPKEISANRSQIILHDLIQTLCDIADESDDDELTQLEQNLLECHTEPRGDKDK